MQSFGLLGAAAYVAPRHLQAISETGNRLVAAMDPYDNVGILDRYAPGCQYFNEFERFDRHLSRMARRDEGINWLSICTPNYLHDSHCLSGLRWGADVICEKPLVLSPWNLDELQEAEQSTGKRIFAVMQLRHHKAIQDLKETVNSPHGLSQYHNVVLTYITGRGPWFGYSWKGDPKRSGGLIFNIGIHFVDMLLQTFGELRCNAQKEPYVFQVHYRDNQRVAGYFELDRARVWWFLSVDMADLPDDCMGTTYRSLTVDDKELEFSGGFENLHTTVYRETLAGRGVSIAETRPAIELAYRIAKADIEREPSKAQLHPLVKGLV